MKNQKNLLKTFTACGLFLAVLVFSGSFLTSCSKDDNSSSPVTEVAPVNSIFFMDYPFTFTSSGSGYYEYGFAFKVAKNGKITKLGCRMPVEDTYRIALWDSTSKSYMIEKSVTAKAAELKMESITPVSLKADTTYLITIYSHQAWYYFKKVDNSAIQYPLVHGNISLLGYYWISSAVGADPKFPTNKDNSYTAGLPEMEFDTD